MKQLVISLLILGGAARSPVSADCQRPRMPQAPFSLADVVFRGTVRDIRNITTQRGYQNITPRGTEYHATRGYTIVSFDVSRVWKGSAGSRFALHMAWGTPLDGMYMFRRDTEYLVFAQKNDAALAARAGLIGVRFTASSCGGTGPTSYESSANYLRFLGLGRPPG